MMHVRSPEMEIKRTGEGLEEDAVAVGGHALGVVLGLVGAVPEDLKGD